MISIEHHADVLSALRHLDAEQLLDRHHVGVLVAHHRHVVETIHVADRLVERLGLGQLLGAPMQQADMRIGLLDDLAVHLQHQAQDAVRGRMLRAEVQREIYEYLPWRQTNQIRRRSTCEAGRRHFFKHLVVTVVFANHSRHERRGSMVTG